MSLLTLPKQFNPGFRLPDIKPVGPVEVDWSNPLTKDLKAVILLGQSGFRIFYSDSGSESFDVLGLSLGVRNGEYGATGFNGSNYAEVFNDLNIGDLTGDWSIVTGFANTNTGSFQTVWDFGNSASDSQNFALQISTGKASLFSRGQAEGSGLTSTNFPTAYDLSDGKPHQIILTVGGGRIQGIVDGFHNPGSGGWWSSTINTPATTNDRLSIGRLGDSSPSSYWGTGDNILGYIYVYERDVYNDGSYRELYRSPYQILKPVNEPLYLTSSAAPGGQTVPVGLSDETDTAFSVVPQQDLVVAVGLTLETDTSLDVSPIKDIIINVGLSEETDEALDVQRLALTDINTADEIDTALDILPIKDIIVNIGTSEETDTAFDAIPIKDILVSVGQSSETDTAFNVFAISEIGQGQEVDEALVVTPKLSGPITIQVNIASEADKALALVSQDQAGDKVISNIIFPIISNIILPIIR